MRRACTFLAVLLLAIAGGCLSSSETGAPPALPDLTGTWTGPMIGYDEGTGFTEYPDLTLAMVVEEQRGRLFAGHFRLRSNQTDWNLSFAGAIGRDNRTLTLTEREGGYCLGEVTGPDTIELTYMQDGSPYSIAVDFLKRGS